jgi:Fe-S oxidoreductase
LPQWLSVAARTPRLANRVLGSSVLGGGLKRLGGVDSRRPLPRLAEEGFRAWLADRPRAEGRAVLLWVDTFTEHFSPAVGQAAVAVLEDAGYDVQVTDEQVCCGLTWISTGQLGAARRRLHRALEALGPALAAGHLVVGLEPSCTAVLRDEVVRLLPDDPRSAVLASRTRTLAQQLRQTPGWRPPDLSHARGIAQPHCHQHAVLGWDDDRELLRDAGAGFEAVGGCCGLAGNFGMERGHDDVSVAVAGTALLPAVASLPPDGEILADGFSCRTQLDHLAGRPGRHLAQLLADQLPR